MKRQRHSCQLFHSPDFQNITSPSSETSSSEAANAASERAGIVEDGLQVRDPFSRERFCGISPLYSLRASILPGFSGT